MQKPSSYYTAPRSDDPILRGWLRSNGAANSSWGGSTSHTLVDDEELPSPLLEIDDQIEGALRCVWTSSSSSDDSDPLSSRLSIATASDIVDLPEIPFVATDPEDYYEDEDEDELGVPIWLRRRPVLIAEHHKSVLRQASGQAHSHSRQRSGSVSSTASRPAPAKSILSCSSSIKTRKGRSTPSVKFLDTPTIHFEHQDDEASYEPVMNYGSDRVKSRADTKEKKRTWGVLEWFTGARKRVTTRVATSDKPLISGPLPLWEGRRYASDPQPERRCASPADAKSMRSVRSTSSMRSIRSCASRFQGYLARLGGKDP